MTNGRRIGALVIGFFVALLTALAIAPRVAAAQACPPGYAWNYRWRRCTMVSTCPPGYARNRFGQCVNVTGSRLCPPGYFLYRGRCMPR